MCHNRLAMQIYKRIGCCIYRCWCKKIRVCTGVYKGPSKSPYVIRYKWNCIVQVLIAVKICVSAMHLDKKIDMTQRTLDLCLAGFTNFMAVVTNNFNSITQINEISIRNSDKCTHANAPDSLNRRVFNRQLTYMELTS